MICQPTNANWRRLKLAWPKLDLRARELLAALGESLAGMPGPGAQASNAIAATTKALCELSEDPRDVEAVSSLTRLLGKPKAEGPDDAPTP